MNKIVKKVIIFSSIAGFTAFSGYQLSSNLNQKTPCNIESRDYEKIKVHSDRIVAHRGITENYVENSYEAIAAAFADEAVGTVEIDIQLTKDNKIVLFHDSKINSLTDGSGEIKNLSLDYLKSVEYYSRSLSEFSELLMNLDSKKKEQLIKDNKISKIATMDEILSIDSNKTLLVDIKFDDDNANKLIAELSKKIISYDGDMNFIFQSTNAKHLKVLREILPNYQYQLIISNKNDFNDNYEDFDMFAIKHSTLDADIVDKLSNDKKQLSVWTIKTKREYDRVRDLTYKYGNVQYISDYPDCVGLWIENDVSMNLNSNSKCLIRKK